MLAKGYLTWIVEVLESYAENVCTCQVPHLRGHSCAWFARGAYVIAPQTGLELRCEGGNAASGRYRPLSGTGGEEKGKQLEVILESVLYKKPPIASRFFLPFTS